MYYQIRIKSAFQGSCSYSTTSQSIVRLVVISKASSPMAKLLVSIFLLYRQQVREWLAISSQENLCFSFWKSSMLLERQGFLRFLVLLIIRGSSW